MNNSKKTLLTKDGLDNLKKEYEELTRTKRPEAVKRMAVARDLGDLTENSEYTAARQDLSFIDKRIAELQEILREAKVVSKGRGKKDKVALGCRVTVGVNKKKKYTYTIVGEWEADPTEKKISLSSPLGEALMGKKVGDEISVEAPGGKVTYTVLEIK